MSSGDAGDITPLLTGGLSVHLPLNFARYDALSALVQPRDLVGSPVLFSAGAGARPQVRRRHG